MEYYNTTTPYEEIDYKGLQYTVCKEYKHISRYKGLRQLIHSPQDLDQRFIAHETANPFVTHAELCYYDVPLEEENRLDLIAARWLGSPTYSWVIVYFNHIEDGFTVPYGQRLRLPKSFFSLFNTGEVLASIPALQLNLITE